MTLDTQSAAWVGRRLRTYQSWMFHEIARHGVRWDSVVDLGCGNGDWTVELAARSRELVVVDFTPEFLEHCQRRLASTRTGQVKFVEADLARFEFDRSCDLVCAGAVTQYLDDSEVHALLVRARTALHARSGLLYMRTTICQRGTGRSTATDQYQAIYRPKAWYLDALRAAGFEVLSALTATEFVADDIARRWLGRASWLLARPLRVGRRAYRVFLRTNVLACVARPAHGTRASPALQAVNDHSGNG